VAEPKKTEDPKSLTEKAPLDFARPVPVAIARWDRALQYPGRASETAVKTEKLANGSVWLVEYLAPIRHFRITYTDPRKKTVTVGFVPECRALSWEPA
jgi:hypothetical protein